MKYREVMDHGRVYEGESYDAIVTAMRECAPFVRAHNNEEYMANVCTRMGQKVTSDPEEFIKRMIISGFIEYAKEENNDSTF